MKASDLCAPTGAGCGTGDIAGVTTAKVDAAGNGDVGRFEAMERGDCIAHWIDWFGHAPPRHISVRLMRKALAHEAQVDVHGAHAPSVRKRLRDVLNGERKGSKGAGGGKPPVAAVLKPGTHLVREWNGRTYQVAVEEDGFRMDGRHYRSPSAIARKITGAHWSGPRFFAVVRR